MKVDFARKDETKILLSEGVIVFEEDFHDLLFDAEDLMAKQKGLDPALVRSTEPPDKEIRAVRKKTSTRLSRGRTHPGGASFPAAPPRSELPSGYAETLGEIKQRIQQERLRVVLTANSAMVLLY